jgi:hypothetical protein
LRFLNVRNRDKLSIALNNIWICQCRIWAREARFDRFASDSTKVNGVWKKKEEEGRVVVRVRGEGVKNIRVVGKETSEGVMKKDGKEEVKVGGSDGKTVKKKEEVATVVVANVGGGGDVVVSKEGKKVVRANKKEEEGPVAGVVQEGGSFPIHNHNDVVRFIPKYSFVLADRT